MRAYMENNMWNSTCLKPTQSHGVPEAGPGAGGREEGTGRRGKTGGGSESRPAEDKSNGSFITRCRGRSGKGGGRRAQAKVKPGGGERRRREGLGARRRSGGGEERKVTGCRSCACVPPTLSVREWVARWRR